MKHTRARNVIGRTFGLLKMRWGILRSPSWYPVKVHNQIIMACCLIHNFIRSEMTVDPLENDLDEFMNSQQPEDEPPLVETIDTLEYSPEWNLWKDNVAQEMFAEWSVNMDAGMEAEKGKVTRGRRCWTKVEEDAVIQCLVGIRELEKGMRKLIPGTDILANPHINSNIHVWKKEYGNLSDLLGKSGIGWNSTTYTLDIIDESVWDAQKRVDHTVKALRHKSFPYYDQWVDIFGKDRATGENARDPADIVDDIHQSDMENQGETDEKLTPDVPETVEIDVTNSVCKPSGSIVVGSTKGKKRKMADSEMKSFVETIGSYMKSSNETFNNLAQCMGTEHDAKIAHSSLNGVMNLIPGLLLEDKLKVSDELVQNTTRLEYFLSLPLDEQTAYVSMLLKGKL
ncbi:hypothetical protein ACS0TY_026879 [Phlomoides rotata]